jgi:hypothetical protein
MRKPLAFFVVACCITVLAFAPALAGPRTKNLPHRYIPNGMDGRLDWITSPVDDTEWSTWAYRNGAEYDIAVSYRDEYGFWSEPLLIGEDDGRDQGEPVLAADRQGTIYVAYAERSPDRIMITWLTVGSERWATPQPLTANGLRARTPALRVIGERLVVAFRSGRGLVIVDFPIVGPSVTANIFNDGPDPVGEQDPFEDEDDPDGTSQDSIFRPDNTQGGQEPPPGDSSNTN